MIIGIITLIVLIMIFLYLAIKKKLYYFSNPCFMFTYEWVAILVLSSLQLFGLYQPSSKAISIIIIGLLSFISGYCLFSKIKLSKKENKKNKNIQIRHEIRYNFLYLLCLVCITTLSMSAISSLSHLMNGASFNDIRTLAQSNNASSGILNFIEGFIVLPSIYTLEIITVADLFRGERNKPLLILTLTILILKTLSDGGRSLLLNFIIYIGIAFIITRHDKQKNNKNQIKISKKRLVFAVAIILAFLTIVTIQRSPSGIFRLSYLYSSMPPVMLDWWTKIVDSSEMQWFGLVSLNGILFLAGYLIKNLFGLPNYPAFIKEPYDLISKTDSQWVPINNNGTKANAYVTMFWFFYADFGIIGVIIGCALYGLFTQKIYANEQTNGDVKSLAFYLLIFWTLLYSFVRLQLAKSAVIVSIIMLLLSFRRKQTYLEDNN